MKKVILIFLFLSTSTVLAQKYVIKTEKEEYHKDKRLNDYLGIWEYSTKMESFKIELLPKKYIGPNKITMDQIRGFHLYILKKDTLQSSFNNVQSKKPTIHAVMENDKNNNLLIIFRDLNYDKNGTARMEFIDEKKTKARWRLTKYEHEEFRLIPEGEPFPVYREGFSVPTEMVLHKVIDD